MLRKLLTLSLTAMVPALAFGAGQHPADSAHAHPASGAHATAMAGQANAARIEACAHAANALINHLAKGDDKAATSDFDTTMKANLGADKLGGTWRQVESQMGKLQTFGTPQNMMYQNHAIVILPLHFEKGDVSAQVACDEDGKIAGFFLRPGETSSGSAPASGD